VTEICSRTPNQRATSATRSPNEKDAIATTCKRLTADSPLSWQKVPSARVGTAYGGAAGNAAVSRGGEAAGNARQPSRWGGAALRALPGSHFAGGGGTGCVARARCGRFSIIVFKYNFRVNGKQRLTSGAHVA